MEKEKADDEIDLIELVHIVWARRRLIVKVTTIFFVLGLIIAFTSKVEYKAMCKLMPENQEVNLPDLGGLGGLVGFNLSGLGKESAVLTPELYPEIVQSIPFVDKLIYEPIYFERIDTTISSFDYFETIDRPSLLGWISGYIFGLSSKIRKIQGVDKELENYGLLRFSRNDWEIIKQYSDRLSISVDTDTGVITVGAEMPDALASATLASLLVDELAKTVTGYKIEKATENLKFIEERFAESKIQYEEKQRFLAIFTDRNRNITNSLVKVEYDRIKNEVDIAFKIYKELATQLEEEKIKVKRETPIFAVLEPVIIPSDKSKPIRSLYVAGFVCLGFIFSVTTIVVRNYLIPRLFKS